MSNELKIGDRVEQTHGPFRSVWEVSEIGAHGAVITYVGPVAYVGYEHPIAAPDGTQLTFTPREGFIGRAHWAATEVLS